MSNERSCCCKAVVLVTSETFICERCLRNCSVENGEPKYVHHLFDEELTESQYQMKWISVKERFPEKDGRYLVVEDHSYRWIGVSSLRNGKFDVEITHWMPLPFPPD